MSLICVIIFEKWFEVILDCLWFDYEKKRVFEESLDVVSRFIGESVCVGNLS